MTMWPVVAHSLLLGISLTVALVACEGVARLFLHPSDYLSVTAIKDDILGIRIAPGSAGFDAWGFRNGRVPQTVDVVAIGDSHTYGNNATMADSWPSVAGRSAGLDVYNLGLGGYGPNQYYYLLEKYALTLKPRWIVCAVYMGDDFENAFLMTYGKEYWSRLREGRWTNVDADIWQPTTDSKWMSTARNWLSQNSILYRLTVHGPLLSGIKSAHQVSPVTDRLSPVTSIILPEENIREAFRPLSIRDRLDPDNPLVREGMRITFELLRRMNDLSSANGARFVVAVIPTKESVFAPYFERSTEAHLREVARQVIASEARARTDLLAFLDEAGIPSVDVLPALRQGVGHQLYTASDGDMHPNRNGYRAIGEAVASFLRAQGSGTVQ